MFLDNDETGRWLKERYEKANNFIHDERLELVRIISDHLVDIAYKMSIPKFEEISHQISMVFAKEDKVKFTFETARPDVLNYNLFFSFSYILNQC